MCFRPSIGREAKEAAHLGRVVADLLDVAAHFLDNFIIPLLVVLGLGGVHLVQGNNHLLHSQSVSQESVLAGLAVLRDTGLETTGSGVDDEHGTIGLAGPRDHILDEVAMARSVNDGAVVLGGLELPKSNIDGDTAFALSLQLVQHLRNPSKKLEFPQRQQDNMRFLRSLHSIGGSKRTKPFRRRRTEVRMQEIYPPKKTLSATAEIWELLGTYPGILEGTLVHFSSFLLELFDDTLVNATQLVDEMASGGGLSGVHMANDNDVQMKLLLTHCRKKTGVRERKDNNRKTSTCRTALR